MNWEKKVMSEDKALWSWVLNADLMRGKCTQCERPMNIDGTNAVLYANDVYHIHCLLTKLTKFHTEQSAINPLLYPG